MDFSQLQISPALRDALSEAVASGRFPHAAVIEDADAARRAQTAALVAQALVCSAQGHRPCAACPDCIKAASGSHPDIRVLAGGETPGSFKVDMVRRLRSETYIVPNEAQRKVYILENAHSMSVQAQNALLKIHEEPPEFVCFLLLCPDRNAFLPTILSRCTVFTQTAGEESEGPGNEQALSAAMNVAGALTAPHEFELLAATAVFEKDKELLKASLPLLSEIFRGAMLVKSGAGGLIEADERIGKLAGGMTAQALLRLMECVGELAAALDRNENYNLLVTRMCALLRGASGG